MKELILNTRIAEDMLAVEEAKADLATSLEQVAAECAHSIVAELAWESSCNARRVCLHCRYEEEGSHWSGGRTWSQAKFKEAILGNSDTRVITPIDRDAFYNLRVYV